MNAILYCGRCVNKASVYLWHKLVYTYMRQKSLEPKEKVTKEKHKIKLIRHPMYLYIFRYINHLFIHEAHIIIAAR